MSTHQIDSTCFKTLDITVLLLTVFFYGSVSANYEAIKGQNANQISSTDSSCTIEIQLNVFHRKINGEVYNLFNLPTGSLIQEHGYPELPKISQSIIIPHGKGISYTIVEQKYEFYSMKVAPSKGVLKRDVDPESIEHIFDRIYQKDKFYPEDLLEIGEPYLIRVFRGVRITDLLSWHYIHVDELYGCSQGGDDAANNTNAEMVSLSVNNGVSLINYIEHSNGNKLPFIFYAACNVGNFTDTTCFVNSG